MDKESTPYRVHSCSKCHGDKEYYCEFCLCDLCPQCKVSHLKYFETRNHYVVPYHKKINYIPTQEFCTRHPRYVYRRYCESCQVPVCDSCSMDNSHTFRSFHFGQGQHITMEIQGAYIKKRQQYRETFKNIRFEALFYRNVLLPEIKANVKTCHTEFFFYQSDMLIKAQKMKNMISVLQNDFMCNVFCDLDFKHRCLEQKIEAIRFIGSLQRYVHIFEQSATRPLQFLLSIKATGLPRLPKLLLHSSQLSMIESLNKEQVIESLSEIKIRERGTRCIKEKILLTLMYAPKLLNFLKLTIVDGCDHISSLASDRVWISDGDNLILTNTTGSPLHRVEDLCSDLYHGFHTVNSESELIYINKDYDINKLSKDMKTTTSFVKRTKSRWRPQCVYCSPLSGDLLVGMYRKEPGTGKVTRYNQIEQLIQTIQHDNTGRGLYSDPIYITENSNGDVVVSDNNRAVVVTERGGRHRFSYTGHPPGLGLWPYGICTDALSHILVCDDLTNTLQMIDKNGQFLSHLLTYSKKMGEPQSLSYDANTHRLWVGSWDSKLCVYKYMARQGALTGKAKS